MMNIYRVYRYDGVDDYTQGYFMQKENAEECLKNLEKSTSNTQHEIYLIDVLETEDE